MSLNDSYHGRADSYDGSSSGYYQTIAQLLVVSAQLEYDCIKDRAICNAEFPTLSRLRMLGHAAIALHFPPLSYFSPSAH